MREAWDDGEQCLRTAEPAMKQLLIEELLQPAELERMLRDSFANYVIQTAVSSRTLLGRVRRLTLLRWTLPSLRRRCD